MKFRIVSEDDAKNDPYPYVYVDDKGNVRELRADERVYLETPFNPMDGNRPYVKSSYDEKNGWENVNGFCPRAAIPPNIPIHEQYFAETVPNSTCKYEGCTKDRIKFGIYCPQHHFEMLEEFKRKSQ